MNCDSGRAGWGLCIFRLGFNNGMSRRRAGRSYGFSLDGLGRLWLLRRRNPLPTRWRPRRGLRRLVRRITCLNPSLRLARRKGTGAGWLRRGVSML
jgi:hypothetical protein